MNIPPLYERVFMHILRVYEKSAFFLNSACLEIFRAFNNIPRIYYYYEFLEKFLVFMNIPRLYDYSLSL